MAKVNSLTQSLDTKFEKINKLDEVTFQELMEALKNANIEIHPGQLAKRIFPQINNVSIIEIQDIFACITTFMEFSKDRDVTHERIVSDIVELVKRDETKSLKFDKEKNEERFSRRVLALLKNQVLACSQYSSEIYYNHKNILMSADITTGINPIMGFGKPKYSVLNAVLKLQYQKDGKTENLYLGIDRSDIRLLKKIILKAEKNLEALESSLKEMGLTELMVDEE